MALIFIYLTIALAISFLCSILEAVLLSTPISYITMLEGEGNKTASLLKNYKSDVDRPVGAILSLNTVAHTFGSAGVGAQSIEVFGEEYFGIISAILTLLILVLSEIIPKTIGASYWRNLALPATKIIRVIIVVTYPLVLLAELVTKVFTKKTNQVSVSREEVSAMVDVGTSEGVFNESESKIIKSCIRLTDIKAKQIMTPKIVVESACEKMTLKEFYDVKDWLFSRILIYGEDKDYVKGYILKEDVLKDLTEDKFNLHLSSLLRPVLTFNEDDSVYSIWEKMLEQREHISIIVDEYSSLRGVVTMEDVIETMIGVEIVDEQDIAVDMQQLAKEKVKEITRTNGSR